MNKSKAEHFLKRHKKKLVNGVRNVNSLLDSLSQPSASEDAFLTDEMVNKVYAKETKQDQMREIYKHLTSTKGYQLMMKWLKKNEPDLMEDLENDSDSDDEAPASKRPRSSAEAVDEIDSNLDKPNFKTTSTFSQIEKWLSESTNSQTLIENLKKKLADGEMEALEKQLKDKKLKKSLCFNSEDVKAITSNRKLREFLDASKDAEFPELTIKLFFEKDGGHATNENMTETDDENCLEEDMIRNTTQDDLSSSGYGSLCTSFNSNPSHSFSLIEGQLSSLNMSVTHGRTEGRDIGQNETKTTGSKPQNTGMQSHSRQAGESEVPKLTRGLHAAQGQNVTHVQTHSETHSLCAASDNPVQNKGPKSTKEQNESHPIQLFDPTTVSSRKSNVSKPMENILSAPSKKPEGDDAPLGQLLNTQKSEQKRQNDSGVVRSISFTEESFQTTSLSEVADNPKERTGPQINPDPNSHTEFESTDMPSQEECKRSDIPQQIKWFNCDHCHTEIPNKIQHENKYGTPVEVMEMEETVCEQSESPDKIHQEDKENTEEAMDKQEMVNAPFTGNPAATELLLSPSLSGASVHCQHETSVEIQHENKDDSPSEGRDMEGCELFTGKVSEAEPSLSSPPNVAADDAVQKKSPVVSQEQGESTPLLQLDHTNITTEKSDVSGQEGDLTFTKGSRLQQKPSETVNETDMNSEMNNTRPVVSEPLRNDPGAAETQTVQPSFFSTPLNDSAQAVKALAGPKRRQQLNNNRLKKRKEEGKLLRDWAMKKCTSEQDLEKVLKCISIETRVEHPEYPLFIVDNVRVYKDPKNDERQIIIVADEKKKTVPQGTRTIVNYQMWVCGVKKAVVLGQKEHELCYSRPRVEGVKEQCERLVFEVFAPALAVFKNVQRQERLYSLVQDQ